MDLKAIFYLLSLFHFGLYILKEVLFVGNKYEMKYLLERLNSFDLGIKSFSRSMIHM